MLGSILIFLAPLFIVYITRITPYDYRTTNPNPLVSNKDSKKKKKRKFFLCISMRVRHVTNVKTVYVHKHLDEEHKTGECNESISNG